MPLSDFTERAKRIKGRLNEENPYNSFVSIVPDIEQKARAIQNRLDSGNPGSLSGMLIGIKDNICVNGLATTCGSEILHDFISPYNATAVDRILQEDGLIVGKTNLDEFAMGSSSEHSCFGSVKNPFDESRVPGGSSGGSAAAVAGQLIDIALGSDTGGSVRQPAAFCGVVGLRPTYGRISRYGLVAFASSLDQIGILSSNVEKTALMLQVIAGYDNMDSTSADLAVPDYSESLADDIDGFKVGIPLEYYQDGLNDEIRDKLKWTINLLRGAGVLIKDISLPHTSYAVAAYYIIATAEASSNLARYDGMRYGLSERGGDLESVYRSSRSRGFGEEVKRRIMLGTYVLSAGYYDAYYEKAQKIRKLIKDDFNRAFRSVDLILTPTTPTTAFKLGDKIDDPLSMYLSDEYTTPSSLAGIPAMNIPIGRSSEGLPIGGQLIGNYFNEETILKVGHYIERNLNSGNY